MAEEFYMQYAAHVDHGITHARTSGQLMLAAGGLALGVVIVISTLPESMTVAFVLESASTVGLSISDGKIIGGLIDTFQGAGITEVLATGLETVRLGPEVKMAARVHEDTVSSGDHFSPAEGSKTVFLGPEYKPMSRRGDRMKCNGTITEGLDTVVVGGVPSQQGVAIEEHTPAALKWLSVLGDILSLPKEVSWKLGVGVVQVGAEIADQDRVSKLAGVPLDKPKNVFEGIKFLSDGKDAAGAALPGGGEGGHE